MKLKKKSLKQLSTKYLSGVAGGSGTRASEEPPQVMGMTIKTASKELIAKTL
ncbi:hypothetical protein PLUTE_a4858 [Pseudoalteromonas luteoviolacea DSM 6061]|nr:hypothetical protein [Pseudoalteromonas luteoviolacea DSM 6061]